MDFQCIAVSFFASPLEIKRGGSFADGEIDPQTSSAAVVAIAKITDMQTCLRVNLRPYPLGELRSRQRLPLCNLLGHASLFGCKFQGEALLFLAFQNSRKLEPSLRFGFDGI